MLSFTFTLYATCQLGFSVEGDTVEDAREALIEMIVQKDEELIDRLYEAVHDAGFDGLEIGDTAYSDDEHDRAIAVKPFESENGPL
jgi:hypothetical protein